MKRPLRRRRPAGAMFWRALGREPRRLASIGFWSVLEAAPAFLIGYAVARAIEDGFAKAEPATGLAWLAALGVAWLVGAVAARQVVLGVAAVAEPFRDDLLTHVVEGTLTRGASRDSAAVARATLQVELARDAFAAVVTTVRGFVFTVAGVVLGLAALAPQALALVLPPFAAGLGLFLASLPALARRQRAFLLADERLADEMTATVGGLRDIEACGLREPVAERLDRQVRAQAAAARALAGVTAARTAALAVGGWLPVVLVLAGTPRLLDGDLGPGVIAGTLAYVTQSLAPALGGLVQGLGVSGIRLAATLGRIAASAPPAGPSIGPPRPRIRPGACDVRLSAVTFAYGPHSAPVVDRLDLAIPEGDHLAVVGPSGAGKSTLAALVSGMLLPGSGEALVGGVPADRLDPAVRVLIPQEAYVFRGTLMENLTALGTPDGPARLDEAVAAVGARELVDELGGYGARLDPAALSAGQRQLIALVRAYLTPAPLVILDEATCHLDPAAEARAETAFARRGGTLVVVAHRLTSALRARRILLMDGTRVSIGTHDELISTSALYADLAGHWHPEPVS
ncbi:ATP-binding cassette domain-containing protein [Nonomuraea angiospora]|uniref:ATP-binding cassette subfamily C protein n=1 Tax=Nonomuraea angiospora TaxID=46172 RepID=A0ABR9LXV6_9ACTN|nr:ABC transporter ATP-binding protein [Nonomuraea angiospora]MBE1585486.1 ATP-binding cassette subfamily C protein [Nonomuraea angiospora]